MSSLVQWINMWIKEGDWVPHGGLPTCLTVPHGGLPTCLTVPRHLANNSEHTDHQASEGSKRQRSRCK